MKKLAAFLFFLLLPVTVQAATVPSGTVSSIAAVVNGDIITMRELESAAQEVLRMNRIDPNKPANAEAVSKVYQEVLDAMINEKILMQDAQRLKLVPTDEELEAELAAIIAESGVSEEIFIRENAKMGIDREKMLESIRLGMTNQRLMGRMVVSKIVVTDDEIIQYYNTYGEKGLPPVKAEEPAPPPQQEVYKPHPSTRYRFSMIMYSKKANAEDLANKIATGELTFEAVARKYSVGPNAGAGGDMGFIALRDIAPGLADLVAALGEGEISPLLDFGSNLGQVKVNAIRYPKGYEPTPPPPPREEPKFTPPTEPSPPAVLIKSLSELDAETRQRAEMAIRMPRMESRFAEYKEQLRKNAILDIRYK